MELKHIPHSRPSIDEADCRAVTESLVTGRLADSSQVNLFEKEMAAYIGHRAAIATNSGTSALYLALLCLEHNNRDEVIIPSFTCIALLNAIHAARLQPKIVDINEDDYNISISGVKRALNGNSKAIIAPHMFGDPIENIRDISSLGLPVIEDCALSIGASNDGKKIGSFSDLSVFSFYATKVLTTGHGGMVLSSSAKMLNTMKDFMLYDNRKEYRLSFNLGLTDFQAALGRSQLSRLDDFVAKRREIARRYDESFRNMDNIKVPQRSKESIYFRYLVEVENADKFIVKMSKQGLDCRKPVFRPLHRYLGLDKKDYPNTERAYEYCLSVPIYPAMKEWEIEYTISRIANS